MKKIFSFVLCAVMIFTLAVVANAAGFSASGECATDITVKHADSAYVIKDGKIGAGEYEEVIVNRDFDEYSDNPSDLFLSYRDTAVEGAALIEEAIKLAQNVHYYYSWDEVNGLNIAVKATLLETPYCAGELPAPGTTDDNFIWQFGMMASVVHNDDHAKDVINASVGYNTVTGKQLVGDWGCVGHGTTPPVFEAGKNYAASVNMTTNEVVFEISYPMATVLPSKDRNGNIPNEDAMISTNVTLTSGNTGNGMEDGVIRTYCVSLGDRGFMYDKWAFTNGGQSAKTYFSHEKIEAPVVTTTPAVTTEPETQIVTSVVTEEVVVTDEAGNTVTDESGNVVTEVVENVVTEIVTVPSTNAGEGTQAPTTGDPMIIAAVVAAISACGVVVAKKRK